ncbi:MAG TPA: hypothetical protein VFQ80_04465, partial [Thermomicrobiales bacterium]|nr:hypothetical protein [Thermomicrobiales bacterium]
PPRPSIGEPLSVGDAPNVAASGRWVSSSLAARWLTAFVIEAFAVSGHARILIDGVCTMK